MRADDSRRVLAERLTCSVEETSAFGRWLAETYFQRGGVVALRGGLGAGKTQVARGLLEGVGGEGREVSSPTFPVLQEYGSGRIPVLHFDWYRLEREEEVEALGWWECLGEGALLVVEWGDRFPRLLEGIGAASLDLVIEAGDCRRLRLTAWEDRDEGLTM